MIAADDTVLLVTRRIRETNCPNKIPYFALAQGVFAAGKGVRDAFNSIISGAGTLNT